ncbi:hypothetical protein ACROYT_G038475 [Oculina patagonica]
MAASEKETDCLDSKCKNTLNEWKSREKDSYYILKMSFYILAQEAVHANSAGLSDSPPKHVKHGTYGNRQVLSVETNGPFTHVFDF